jgi:hypothetical protein
MYKQNKQKIYPNAKTSCGTVVTGKALNNRGLFTYRPFRVWDKENKNDAACIIFFA